MSEAAGMVCMHLMRTVKSSRRFPVIKLVLGGPRRCPIVEKSLSRMASQCQYNEPRTREIARPEITLAGDERM
jgi:hypothetical protein